MKKTVLLSIATMLLFASIAHAETLAPGQKYTGKKTLEVPAFQISFQLPAGYAGMLPAGTEWFHVGKDNEVGRVFMWASRASEADLRMTMSSQFPVANSVMLQPTGEIRKEGAALVADYNATDGMTQYKAQVRALTKGGVTVALVAVATPDKLGEFSKLAKAIEKTVNFGVKPKAARNAGPAGSIGSGPWAAELTNKRVVRYYHGSGYSEKTQYWLCGTGNFYNNFNATSSSMAGSGVAVNRAAGRWSVQGNVLSLRWSDGNVSQHQLSMQGTKMFVDGQRWLRESSPCQ